MERSIADPYSPFSLKGAPLMLLILCPAHSEAAQKSRSEEGVGPSRIHLASAAPSVTVVVPFLDEADTLVRLRDGIDAALSRLDLPYEIIFL